MEEVISLFPSKRIHIGGDEVSRTRWKQSEVTQAFIQMNNLRDEHELQGYFYWDSGSFYSGFLRKCQPIRL